MLDTRWTKVMTEAYDWFLQHLKEARLDIPSQTPGAHRLDREVINYVVGVLAESGTDIKCVRASSRKAGRFIPIQRFTTRATCRLPFAMSMRALISCGWRHPNETEGLMIKPEEVQHQLSEHFEQVSLEEFRDRVVESGRVEGPSLPVKRPDFEVNNVVLFQREAAPLKLNAYLASALTGLDADEKERLIAVSEVVVAVCDKIGIEVYEPRLATDPVHHPEFSSEEVFNKDREQVLSSDLVVHVADYASTGAGEELDFALAALIPIVLISHGDAVVSRMVLGVPALKLIITYNTLDELRVELDRRLTEIKPILDERKLSFAEFDKNIVGNKVRVLREEARLTRGDLVSNSQGLFTADRLRAIEEQSDKMSNPSLIELRALATILKTTVADLAEPDLQERLYVMLQEWLNGKVAARYGISDNDRNKIITRVLLRVIDSLQRD